MINKYSSLPACSDNKGFTVFYMGDDQYFQTFNDVSEFISFYRYIPKGMKHYYEVISTDYRKMIVDIDEYISLDNLFILKQRLMNIFYELFEIETIPVIFDSSNKNKYSYHIIVPSYSFTRETCMYILYVLDSKFCDQGVYKTIQFFRIEGSTKIDQNRYKYLLNYDKISIYLEHFLVTPYNSKKINKTITLLKSPVYQKNSLTNIDLTSFKLRKARKGFILLDRVSPGYCQIHNRIHHKENAYLIYTTKWMFKCFRDQ